MPDKGGLQLLPETRKKITIITPGENRFIYFGISTIIIILGVYGGLLWYSHRVDVQLTDANTTLTAQEQKRDKASENMLLTLNKQFGTTSQVLKNHTFWSAGFSRIESAMLNNIQFKSFTATADTGTIQIQGLSNSYTILAQQLASFTADDSIKDVTLSRVATETSGKLTFSMTVKFDPAKFLKTK